MRRGIDRLRLWIRSLFRGGRVDAELQRELRFHLDREIAEQVAAGMSPEEARRAALRAFGGPGKVAEECRDARRVSFLSNLIQDLRYTRRSLSRQPLMVVAATLSIAVGVSANSTIFGLANELLLAAPTVGEPNQVVHIWMGQGSHVSYPQWRALDASGALSGIAGYQMEREVNWQGADRSVALMPLIVTANFFDVLRLPMAMGRGFTAAEARAERKPRLVVLSHGFWQKRLGGDPAVVGRTLTFNREPYTVVGVTAKNLRSITGFGLAWEVYLPLSRRLMPDLDEPAGAAVSLAGRLHDGQSVAQGRSTLAAVAQRLANEHPKWQGNFADLARFTPVVGLGQWTDFQAIGAFFGLLLVVVGLVLAIACANVAGLLLARGTVRRREIAMRQALGASRARLVQQFLTEGLWLALLGTVGGLLLALALMRLLSAASLPLPLPIELHVGLDRRLLAHALVLLVLTTVLCSLAPALQSTRAALVPSLKPDVPRLGRRWTLRGLLVAAQVALSMVLLLTAFLFLRNLARTHSMDPGFDTARTLVAQVTFVEEGSSPEADRLFLSSAVERLRALPGVVDASYASAVPLTLRSGRTIGADVRVQGRDEAFQARYEGSSVGPAYFSTMGIPVVKGREFRPEDSTSEANVAVVNAEFVQRYLAGLDPVGAHVLLPGPPDTPGAPTEIVGVVANGKHRTLGEEQHPAVYEPYRSRGRFVFMLVRTSEDPAAALKPVQRILGSLAAPSAAVEVQTMQSMLAFAFLPSQIGAVLLGTLGLLGLLLAMVGLYAVMSYSVSRRTAEIGIRMALGASHTAVRRLVLRDAAWLAGCGIAVGLAVALFVTRPLALFLVAGLSTTDPFSFATTALVLGVVCLAASWQPARRAMRIDPMTALREE